MVTLFLYRILYVACFLLYLPKLMIDCWKKKSWKVTFRRLFPSRHISIQKEQPVQKTVWIHAVSFGETVAVAPLIQELKRLYPSWRCITSHATQAGYETSQRLMPFIDAQEYLPFEFGFSIRRMLSKWQNISLLIHSEGDVWPLFMDRIKAKGAKICIVSGKLSHRSFNRYMKFPRLSRWIFKNVDLFCLQNEETRQLYEKIGISKQRLVVTGNMKADVDVVHLTEPEKQQLCEKFILSQGDKLIVLGSTHSPEEREIMQELEPLLSTSLRVAVVPRHAHRFEDVYKELQSLCPEKKVVRYSHLNKNESSKEAYRDWEIVVVDAMGFLTSLYQIAYIAVVCGSFVSHIGGHNILEPACVATPICVGPYMHSQQWMFNSAVSRRAIMQYKTPKKLARAIARLVVNESTRANMAAKAYAWAQECKGAKARTREAITALIHD